MLDQKTYQFLERIMKYKQITKPEMMLELDLTERRFDYLLEKVNNSLAFVDLPPLQMENQWIVADERVKEFVASGGPLDINGNDLIISEENRPLMIYLYTFIKQEPISGYHFQLLLNVSKNTALADVKKAREWCLEWNVEFVYKRMEGYHLQGAEMDKRRFALYCLDYLLSQPLGREIIDRTLGAWHKEEMVEETTSIMEAFLDRWQTIRLVRSRKVEMVYHLVFMRTRSRKDDLLYTSEEKRVLEEEHIYPAAEELAFELFPEGPGEDVYFTAVQLLTSQGEVNSDAHPLLMEMGKKIVAAFEKNTLLPIENKASLIQSLFNHLVPTYYRLMFDIPLINPMKEVIKGEYGELFQFVRRSLKPLAEWTGKQISEAEIGYFTLHFGGYLERDRREKPEDVKALVICSNGVSSSIMLRAQLKEMFPAVQFSRAHTADSIGSVPPSSYDLIFSTVALTSIKPVFLVKPLLSSVEKTHLIQSVREEFPSLHENSVPLEKVMEVIRRNTDIKNEKKLVSELIEIMYFKNTEKRWEKPLLSDLLTKETIHFTNEKLDWRSAISKAAEPLLDTEKIEQRYIDAMIQNVEEIGTYIHIGKGIAIPHARPDAGVKEVGMSFLRTREPVLLLDKPEHSIDLFICLAAIDNEAHLKALAHLTKLLGDNTKLAAIKDAASEEEIMEIIKEGEEL
ncbi:BglG family transcription antiterminator [Halobacillus sp. KGW1]|uniref:BglG family transcription antiterminator n=1 Tax=Halobacillus sp. KGW1 TaxID=1793726 RepID=UPI000782DD38|nr:BglG family transcription antiterminator [Halobacillus sp. KGW1]